MISENRYIDICKKKIADKTNISLDSPTQRDYEFLNSIIFSKSKIDISTATLRRIWSNSYKSVPQVKTLDALAQLIEYENWHQFKIATQNDQVIPPNGMGKRKRFALVVLVPVAVMTVVLISMYSKKAIPAVSFEAETTVHNGVPATIGFNYDIASAADLEIEIELSWNPYERTMLNHENNFYTGTYYYPDYHHAKLLYEDSVLATSSVHITTSGWHGLVMKTGLDPSPVYLKKEDYLFENKLKISNEIIKKYNLDKSKNLYPVLTFSSSTLEAASGDEFSIEFELRMPNDINQKNCQSCDLIIKSEEGLARIPITQSGCYGLSELRLGGKVISGKTNDLSKLSTDLNVSSVVRVKSNVGKLFVKVADNEEFVLNYDRPMGDLKVVKFIFNGFGEIASFSLFDGNGQKLSNSLLYPF